jgi:hypothetical protein
METRYRTGQAKIESDMEDERANRRDDRWSSITGNRQLSKGDVAKKETEKAGQDKTRQDDAWQEKTSQDKTRQGGEELD